MNEYQIKSILSKLVEYNIKNDAEHKIIFASIDELKALIEANEAIDRIIEARINKMQTQLDRLFILLESIEDVEEEKKEDLEAYAGEYNNSKEEDEETEEKLEEAREELEEIKENLGEVSELLND